MSRVLLITFILALAIFPLLILITTQKNIPLNSKKTSNSLTQQADESLLAALLTQTPSVSPSPTVTPILSITKSISPVPSLSPVPTIFAYIEATNVTNMETNYQAGTMVNARFSFVYPKGWKVLYEKDKDTLTQNKNTYIFSFTPEQAISQNMTIAIFAPFDTIQNFIKNTYPTYQVSWQKYGTIGNKTLYKLSSSNATFGSRGVVMGQKQTYVISFDSSSDHTIIGQIQTTIWPTFTFQ